MNIMALARVTEFALAAIRLGLGIVLFFLTTLLAGIIGKFSFEPHVPFGTRCLLVLLSLSFVLQSYAACRILLFRRKGNEAGPTSEAPGL